MNKNHVITCTIIDLEEDCALAHTALAAMLIVFIFYFSFFCFNIFFLSRTFAPPPLPGIISPSVHTDWIRDQRL